MVGLRINDLENVQTLLTERGMEWAWHWHEAGRQLGRREGEVIMMCRILTRRFGPPPQEVITRLCLASKAQFERWADRLLVSASLEDVLSTE